MGWTTTNRNGKSLKEFLAEQLWPHKVIDIAVVYMRTAYIAFELKDGTVTCGIFLLQFNPGDGYEIGYKDMDETVGPYERNCPERILKLLTAEPVGYAAEWRADCWKNIEKKKAIKNGGTIVLDSPLRFSDGVVRQRFRKIVKSKYFYCLEDDATCRLSSYQLQNATVEK
jgi:hypothetical protein